MTGFYNAGVKVAECMQVVRIGVLRKAVDSLQSTVSLLESELYNTKTEKVPEAPMPDSLPDCIMALCEKVAACQRRIDRAAVEVGVLRKMVHDLPE